MTDLSSSHQGGSSFVASRERSALLAALPVVTCMLLPLTQIAGLFYLYDLALGLAILSLGIPRIRINGARRFRLIWILFVIAILIGWLSAMLRTGIMFRPTLYTVQFLLGLVYARALYENIVTGRLDLKRFATVVVWAGVILAVLGICQFLLFQINSSLAASLYRQYLDLSGFSSDFFDTRYLAAVRNNGLVRVVGTWDVTTTYAGMLALSAAWLLIYKPPTTKMLMLFSIIMVAIMMTGSRHGWLIGALLLFGLAGRSSLNRILVITIFFAILMSIVLIVESQSNGSGTMTFIEQVIARYDRTIERGLEDSSIQLRYVEGTGRFLSYAFQDPMMLLFGVGTGIDKSLYEALGPIRFHVLMDETHNLGFVSNSWLLIWRNWGILAFIALVSIFFHINRMGGSATRYGLLVVGLIFVADNYAAQVARCFFLLFVFMTALAAQGLMERQRCL